MSEIVIFCVRFERSYRGHIALAYRRLAGGPLHRVLSIKGACFGSSSKVGVLPTADAPTDTPPAQQYLSKLLNNLASQLNRRKHTHTQGRAQAMNAPLFFLFFFNILRRMGQNKPHFHVLSYASCVDLTQLPSRPSASRRVLRIPL